MAERVVVDASAIVDVLAGTSYAAAVRNRLEGTAWHAPAHIDAEVLSALSRLAPAEPMSEPHVRARVDLLGSLPVQRQLLPPLLAGAWTRRADLRLVDALYVELAHRLDAPLITTDQRLARATPLAEPIGPDAG